MAALSSIINYKHQTRYIRLSQNYKNICNLISYEDVNICRICARSAIWQYCTAVQMLRKNFKMADSENPPESQLKQHVLVWVTPRFWTISCQFHILYTNESGKIRNLENKTSGTSMEHKWLKWGIICLRCLWK